MQIHSSIRFAAPLCLLAVALAACASKGEDDGSGGSSSAQTTADTSASAGGGDAGTGGAGGSTAATGGSDPGEPGWTIMPLLNDDSDPEYGTVFREGNDLVTGIRFDALDKGFIVTDGDEGTFQNGGAIFSATQNAVAELEFSGNRDGLCLLGTIGFQGIEKSPDGYYALAHACDIISSKDGGATFDIEPNGAGEQFGIERVYAIRTRADETLAVHDHYLTRTSTAPGPDALWDDVWAPEAVPTTPNPVPEDQCQGAPAFGATPMTAHAYVGPDGTRVAYVSNEELGASVCVSDDAGRSFFPRAIPDLGEDAAGFSPDGVVFASDTVGITWWANYIYPGQQYIARTTDGGQTWAQVALPEEVGGVAEIELRSGFFAPDGQNGWLVGYDWDHDLALILRTTDGGATWARTGGDLGNKVSDAGGGKLHTGFALDANHIWVGGEYGILASNSAGGE